MLQDFPAATEPVLVYFRISYQFHHHFRYRILLWLTLHTTQTIVESGVGARVFIFKNTSLVYHEPVSCARVDV